MTLRGRISVLVAAVVGVTLVSAAFICFFAMRAELRSQVDSALRGQAQLIRSSRQLPTTRLRRLPAPPARQGGAAGYGQILHLQDGKLRRLRTFGARPIPIEPADVAVARRASGGRLDDREVAGVHTRVLTFVLAHGTVLQLGRSLAGADSTLSRLRVVLAGLCGLGMLLATLLAASLSRRALSPLTRLTEAAEHIETTGDLGRRVPVRAAVRDEPGRLAQRLNAMLDRLQASQAAQRQLIADASHELRTPVTALRTNVELLADGHTLTGSARAAIAADANHQAEELSVLVADVIELARGDERPLELEELSLAELVEEAVERGRRHSDGHQFTLTVDAPAVVEADATQLARALNNIVDNAIKYAPAATPIDAEVRGAEIIIVDRGPGVSSEELPHVFDRFYRGHQARSRVGSGLGLAIVKQIVDKHGGSVWMECSVAGGTRVRLTLPEAAP